MPAGRIPSFSAYVKNADTLFLLLPGLLMKISGVL
jgi:hypothetical protein